MQTGNPYDCANQVNNARVPSACGDNTAEKARISDYAFIRKGLLTPAIVAGGFAGLMQALLAAEKTGDAQIFREMAGAYDGGAPQTANSGGRSKTQTTSRLHTFDLSVFDYVGNEKYWDSMELSAGDWDFVGFTGTRLWPVVNQGLGITAKGPIVDDPDADILGSVTVTYSDRPLLKSYPFNRALLAKKLAAFLPFTSITAGVGATVSADNVSVASGTAGKFTVVFGPVASGGATPNTYFLAGAIPAWASIDPATGVVTIAATAPLGSYELDVRAADPNGVLGRVFISVLVA